MPRPEGLGRLYSLLIRSEPGPCPTGTAVHQPGPRNFLALTGERRAEENPEAWMGPALWQLAISLRRIKNKTQNSVWGVHGAITVVTPINTFYRASFAPDSILIESCILTQLIFTTTL